MLWIALWIRVWMLSCLACSLNSRVLTCVLVRRLLVRVTIRLVPAVTAAMNLCRCGPSGLGDLLVSSLVVFPTRVSGAWILRENMPGCLMCPPISVWSRLVLVRDVVSVCCVDSYVNAGISAVITVVIVIV